LGTSSSQESTECPGTLWSQEPAVAERLSRALDGRGAFRRFKDEVARMGISEGWYAFRDDARASLARDFLESHGVRWK